MTVRIPAMEVQAAFELSALAAERDGMPLKAKEVREYLRQVQEAREASGEYVTAFDITPVSPGAGPDAPELPTIEAVIAEYDRVVRENYSPPDWDTIRLVAEDDMGEVVWEVREVAERMGARALLDTDGPDFDQTWVDALQDATEDYQARLRKEVEAR